MSEAKEAVRRYEELVCAFGCACMQLAIDRNSDKAVVMAVQSDDNYNAVIDAYDALAKENAELRAYVEKCGHRPYCPSVNNLRSRILDGYEHGICNCGFAALKEPK